MPPSPQLENGYLRIATELAEALARVNLSPYESRILWFVIRRTYGFNKKVDRISLSQFSKGTGVNPQHARRAVKSLIDKQILVAHPETSQRILYGLQKDYGKWTGISQPLPKQGDPIQGDSLNWDSLSRSKPLPAEGNEPLPKEGDTKDIKTITKDNGAADAAKSPLTVERVIRRLNELAGTSYQPRSKTTHGHINARLREGFTETDLLAVVEDRCTRWLADSKMREYLRPATLFNSEKFEGYLQAARANGANGASHEPTVKDLGNGWVEVDGVKMEHETYKVRYVKAK